MFRARRHNHDMGRADSTLKLQCWVWHEVRLDCARRLSASARDMAPGRLGQWVLVPTVDGLSVTTGRALEQEQTFAVSVPASMLVRVGFSGLFGHVKSGVGGWTRHYGRPRPSRRSPVHSGTPGWKSLKSICSCVLPPVSHPAFAGSHQPKRNPSTLLRSTTHQAFQSSEHTITAKDYPHDLNHGAVAASPSFLATQAKKQSGTLVSGKQAASNWDPAERDIDEALTCCALAPPPVTTIHQTRPVRPPPTRPNRLDWTRPL